MDAPAEPFSRDLLNALEERILPAWLPARRWWRAKARVMSSLAIEAAIPVTREACLCIVRADFARGEAERYAVPLALVSAERTGQFPEDSVAGAASDGRLFVDAAQDPAFRDAVLELLKGQAEAKGFGGILRGRPDSRDVFAGMHPGAVASRLYAGEQSNTSFNFDERVVVKLYRRVEPGIHTEPEMLRALRHAGFVGPGGAPAFLSMLEWVPGTAGTTGAPVALAVAQEFVRDAALAWDVFVDGLTANAALRESAAALGASVGALHAALSARADDPDFAPEPLTEDDLAAARAGSLARLEASGEAIEPDVAARLAATLQRSKPAGAKFRVHGDLHLGQILLARDGIRILDFEGEPGRPLAQARLKASPLRDVAGMLRSFHYAAHVAARRAGGATEERLQGADRVANDLSDAFRDAWIASIMKACPDALRLHGSASDRAGTLDLLNYFILEKALYELEYERNNRPDWIEIPRRGLRNLAG